MAKFYKQNLAALSKCNPVLAQNFNFFIDYLNKVPNEQRVKREDGKLKFKFEETWYCLSGKHPKQEAIYMTKELNEYKEYLILVFGIANIELLTWLEKNTNEGTKIAVFEPDPSVLKYCIFNYNLDALIQSKKFGFLLGDDEMIKREALLYFSSSWENLIQNIKVISLPNYYLYADYRKDILQLVREKIDHLLKSYGNSLPDMMNGFRNHFRNIDSLIKANDCREIQDKYKGYPAIVVASGPSLDKNIDELRAAQGKALIIACDASYQICMEHGIVPDMIASIERDKPTYDSFYKGRTFHDELVLIGPSLLWPDIHREFPGKQILFSKNCTGIEQWWSDQFPKSVFIDLGHSCASVGYAVARYAGCDPVIFCGLDLAFTDNKRHSSRVQELSFKMKNELGEKQRDKSKGLWVEDIHGELVKTTDVFNLFRMYFEKNTLYQGTMIDATEGGALIHGTVLMTLKEAIEKHCNKEIPFRLTDILTNEQPSDGEIVQIYDRFIKAADAMLAQIKEVQKRCVEHYNLIKKFKNYKFEQLTEQELVDVVLDLQQGDAILNYIREERSDIVSFYQQVLKYTVIYVKAIGNELTWENVKRNWELQSNLMNLLEIASVSVGNQLIDLIGEVKQKRNHLAEKIGVVEA